jgi:excisionase family DNA binding protein
MKKPKSYTITEAAKALGISRAAVHEAIKSGRLKAKVGTITKTIVQETQGWVITDDAIKSYQVSAPHQTAGKKITDA